MKNTKQNIKIQFKEYSQNIWQVWTDNVYIRDITVNDINVLCAEVESENAIVNMSPNDFISMVWDLCAYQIFDNYSDFDYYGNDFKAFSKWFDKEVLDWYCRMIKVLI